MNEPRYLKVGESQQWERQEQSEGLQFYEDLKAILQEDRERGVFNPLLISATEFEQRYGDDGINDLYQWYALAMQRRERAPLEFERFIDHFFNGGSFDDPRMYGDMDNGFLLGFEKEDVFIPTHFAPKSLRGGYNLMLDLGESELLPAVMAITEDLKVTIEKMPCWHSLPEASQGIFRSFVVDKWLVYNSHPDILAKLQLLAENYDQGYSSD